MSLKWRSVAACLLAVGIVAPVVMAQSYEWKSVAIRGGGFVSGIVFSPAEKNVIYARTDMAGAYRWDEENGGWVAITDWLDRDTGKYFGIESIAPDPTNADVVYLAGGTYTSSGNGAILRSKDRCKTWEILPIDAPMGGNQNGRSMGERLAVDPNLPSILYFGSRNRGLLRSVDFATTWTQVASFPDLSEAEPMDQEGPPMDQEGPPMGPGGPWGRDRDLGLGFVVFDKSSGTSGKATPVIYVGAAKKDEGSNLYRSTDAGATWQLVPGGPTKLMPHHVAMASDGTIYLAYNDGPGPNGVGYGEVWKFDPAKNEWTEMSPPKSGGGFGGISVDPSNPKHIIVSTLDRWKPDEIYRRSDDGTTWTAIGSVAKRDNKGVNYLYFGRDHIPANLSSMGWMGDIEIDPFRPGRAFYITGQGVWMSENSDAKSPQDVLWRFENTGLEETVVLDMVPSVNGAFFSAVGDIGGARFTNLDEPPEEGMYSNPVFGNCETLDVSGLDAKVVVRTSRGGESITAYSTNNGRSWKPLNVPEIKEQEPPFSPPPGAPRMPWRHFRMGGPLAVAADGSAIVWSPSNGAVMRTEDFGTTWTECQGGLPQGVRVVADRVNPKKFYAYADGTLYASEDGAKTFTAKAAGIVEPEPTPVPDERRGPWGRMRWIKGKVRAVFGREGDVWIAVEDKLFHATESGAKVERIKDVDYVYSVGFGKAAPGKDYPVVYLSGKVKGITGIFRSLDMGATWERINDAAHQFGSVDHIAGDENIYGRVYIGPHGRGVLYGDLADAR
jgi:hypothetical protein